MKIHTRAPLSVLYGGRLIRADVGWEQGTEEVPYASYEHRQLDTLLKKYRVSVPSGSYADISR
jgi:hypothetical protein